MEQLVSPNVPWAPARTIRWFETGEHCSDAQAGDLVLVEHATGIASVIRFGERLAAWRMAGIFRPNSKYRQQLLCYCWANHAAIAIGPETISEQVGKGNKISTLDKYIAKRYAVVHFEVTPEQADSCKEMALSFKGVKYGWFSIGGMAFDLITGLRLAIGTGRRVVCSAMAAECLIALGLRPDKLIDVVMPSDLCRYAEVGP